jgi:hypothetical protein
VVVTCVDCLVIEDSEVFVVFVKFHDVGCVLFPVSFRLLSGLLSSRVHLFSSLTHLHLSNNPQGT